MSEQAKPFVPFVVSVDTPEEAAALARIFDAANRFGLSQPGNSLANSAEVLQLGFKFNGAMQIASSAAASVENGKRQANGKGKRH